MRYIKVPVGKTKSYHMIVLFKDLAVNTESCRRMQRDGNKVSFMFPPKNDVLERDDEVVEMTFMDDANAYEAFRSIVSCCHSPFSFEITEVEPRVVMDDIYPGMTPGVLFQKMNSL